MKSPGKHKKAAKAPKLHTMKHQITFTFIGLLLLSVLAITLINGIFLEKYYVSRKKEVLLEAKEVLAQIDVDEVVHDDGTEEELPSQIAQSGSRNNLTWVLITEITPSISAGRRMRISCETSCFSGMQAIWMMTK